MAVGIYKITSPTNKVYIGQSWELSRRLREYEIYDCKSQRKLYNSVIKYGWEAHEFEILMNVSENVSQEMLDQIEQTYMDYYRKLGFELMNLKGAGSRGKLSEESKKIIGIKLRGRKLSEDHKNNIREGFKSMDAQSRKDWGEKISRAKSGVMRTGVMRKNGNGSKPVSQYTKDNVFVRNWPSLIEVTRQLGINTGNIASVLQHKRNSAGGFKWKYKGDI